MNKVKHNMFSINNEHTFNSVCTNILIQKYDKLDILAINPLHLANLYRLSYPTKSY